MDEKGNSVFEDYPLFTEKFRVDHINQELTVHISEAVYQNEILDEAGNIIQNKKRVVDLFNNDDWSETKYLKFGRELHNQLKKYGQNLYRWIAEYRSINRPIAIDAEVFENIIMKFTTPYAKKNKLTILNSAIKELQSLTYDDGRQIIRDLEYTIERKNRKIVKYIFSFKSFSIDLNYIKRIDGSNIVFEESSASKGDDNHLEYFNVIQLFLKTFSNKPEYDNKNNRQRLVKFCQSMSEEVVVVALDKVTMNKRRGPGWLFKTLENWEKAGVKKMEDIESAEREIFGESQKTNVPSWSNPNYRNEITEEQRQELERKKAEMLKKLDS